MLLCIYLNLFAPFFYYLEGLILFFYFRFTRQLGGWSFEVRS